MKGLLLLIFLTAVAMSSGQAVAGDAHSHGHGSEDKPGALVAACKTECPNAKTEHEAHNCTKKLAKKKDAKFADSACFKAHVEHEKHEAKEDKHKH